MPGPTTPQLPVLLTVRGTTEKPIDEARNLHNETAGSAPGMAAARSLGDLSHHVYAPYENAQQSSAKKGELLFMDTWVTAEGIMKFFSNEEVQRQGSSLFTKRDPSIWMPARNGFTFAQPAPTSRGQRFAGLVRGPVADPEAAVATFARAASSSLSAARRRGLISHGVFIKLAAPGDTSPVELLGVELWFDPEGMQEHYRDEEAMKPLGSAFAGRPDASMWVQGPGHWNEW